jgi:hypothetical protein
LSRKRIWELQRRCIDLTSDAMLRSLSNYTILLALDRALQQGWSFDVDFIIGASNERAIGMNMKKIMILILLQWSSATNQTAGRGSAIKNLLKRYVKGVNLIPQGERVRRGGYGFL